ncbi:52 kDa repressor of the inhibitor of the protein kinase [Eumeta japonica]|uniref:52 kDa repressor of the inhibitor of the protein kinase n=1 Tax=Eumeta variegata TaxID=151549 RepID=A0A4C1ZJE4_EUMVA|nr:52 kDa repressor of the inhibitor of the protein kinase [Eumeta japonica]
MEGHTAQQLAQSLLDFLSESGIDIKDCRGQSYDNASNMSGKYTGLQARIKEINKYAEYIPCLAHSLNLVAKCATDCCTEALLFFDFIENLYTFFSASTYRWSRLTSALRDSTSNIPILKRLSDTRWSARADATKAFLCGFMTIKQVLEGIFNNVDQKAECRNKAYGLVSTMNKLETGIMTITWNGILERLQATSASLQSSDQDLNTGYALYESLYGYVQAMRSIFSDIEARAKDLTNCEEYQQQSSRQIKRNTKYDHFSGSTTFDDGFVENQTHGQRFEVQVFIVIIDNVLSALTKRMKAYHKITSVYEVFRQLKFLTTEEILEKSSNMVSAYEDDLENSLGGELVQFAELLKTDMAIVIDSKKPEPLEQQFYKFLINNSLGSCFPNLEIALRIYLSLMITNCSGERSFSTLKRIKTELRNTMG